MKISDALMKFCRENIPLFGVFFSIILFSILTPFFYKPVNIINILLYTAINGIMAIGLTPVVIGGSFDLSIGSAMALCAAIAIGLQKYLPIPLSILIAIMVGTLIGVFNGLLITKARINSFIATLATYILLYGMLLLYTKEKSIYPDNDVYKMISEGTFLRINYPIWILFITLILTHIMLIKTRVGRYIYAMGGNEYISRLFGINIDMIRILTFVICGIFSSISGILLSARVNSASPLFGQNTMLIVFGAVILGGTSIKGGEGTVIKSFIAVLFLSILQNSFTLLGVPIYYQLYIWGGALIIITTLDRRKHKEL